jgi:hypothetical protein
LKKVKEGKTSAQPLIRKEPLPEIKRNDPNSISLNQAFTRQPVSFSGKRDEADKKDKIRKEVNLNELKKTLEESLGKMKPSAEDENEGFKRI